MMRSAARVTKPHTRSSFFSRTGEVTYDEFAEIIPDGQKADLIAGVIYMASPDNTRNADLQAWLQAVLYEFIQCYQLGKLFTSRVAFKLSDKNAPEPDISFVPVAWQDTIRPGRVEGPPALAIEIVSPESVHRDYVIKRDLYETAGVLEYWILDETARRATFLYRRGTRLIEGKPKKHLWHSKTLKGFTLDVRWLWMDQRPSVFSILRDHYYPKS